MNYLNCWQDLRRVATQAEVLSLIEQEIVKLGFSRMLLAILPRRSAPLSQAFIHSNYPSAWRARYDASGMAAIDPTVLHCLTRTGPLVWNERDFTAPSQRDLYEEACKFGIAEGVSLPAHHNRGASCMLTCVADDSRGADRFIERELPHLVLLRDLAFDSLQRFAASGNAAAGCAAAPESDAKDQPNLSSRETECLRWHAAGKTSWEIGRILNVTEAGVNFHFKNIRSKFNVRHRHEALIKALALGIITSL